MPSNQYAMRINVSTTDDRNSDEAVVVRAVLRLARQLRRAVPSAELTGGVLSLLVALCRGGPMSAVMLARSEGLQPQSLSRLLARMARDGLIERPVDPKDRRRQVISVTPRGLDALGWAMTQRRRWLAAAMADRLDDAERAVIVHAAELILRIAF